MYPVSPALYSETAARLADAIDGRSYFSGSVAFGFEGIDCRLTASVFVSSRRESLPEGEREAICDLVPVWWEFRTTTTEGEMLNDFDFACLRELLT